MGKNANKNNAIRWLKGREDFWFSRITRLACASITWDGLPAEIPVPYLEKACTMTGAANIIRDKDTGIYMVGDDSSVGNTNIYGTPNDRAVTFYNGVEMRAGIRESVIVYNNVFHEPDIWLYRQFASQLADLDIAIAINCNSQKTVPILPTSPQQKLSVENAYQNVIENIPYILVDKDSFDLDGFKNALQFDNRKSFTSDQMMVVQREIWNRVLTLLGINNSNVIKAERVNVQETNSNLDEIMVMRESRLSTRRVSARHLKRKFGIDCEPRYVSDLRQILGGDGNGMVYDASAVDLSTKSDRFRATPGQHDPGRDNSGNG